MINESVSCRVSCWGCRSPGQQAVRGHVRRVPTCASLILDRVSTPAPDASGLDPLNRSKPRGSQNLDY